MFSWEVACKNIVLLVLLCVSQEICHLVWAQAADQGARKWKVCEAFNDVAVAGSSRKQYEKKEN